MGLVSPIPRPLGEVPAPEHAGYRPAAHPRRRALAPLGVAGLLCVLVGSFVVAAGSATEPNLYVPGRTGGWPGWLAGPFQGLGLGIDQARFQTFTLVMCAGYLVVLACARAIPPRALVASILAAHLIFLLGPPLLSQDVFGYLGFARLGVLHGLDPYTHVAAAAAGDPVFPFLGWPFQHSPYGPLFTLASYAIVPLGLAGGLWALKAIAVLSSLAAVALVWRAAELDGRPPALAAAFLGLNPVLLEVALGGDHNDTLILLAVAGALALAAGASRRPRAAAALLAAGVGVKVTAGVALPFLVLSRGSWRGRLGLLTGAAVSLSVLATVALVAFGSHALGFLSAVGEQQQLVATHSIPAETARLVGLHGIPAWWRQIFAGGFVAALALTLWRTARGADWRAMAGWATLALLLCTAWFLPWYAIWALPLAALSPSRALRAATLVFCAYAISIHLPLASPLLSAPQPTVAPLPRAFAVPAPIRPSGTLGADAARGIAPG